MSHAAAGHDGTAYIGRLDSLGAVPWSDSLADSLGSFQPTNIAETESGGYINSGMIATASFSDLATISKFSAAGAPLWHKTIARAGGQRC